MRVLVGCERSGKVRDAFRRRGHDAWSCDLAPGGGEFSEYHHQCDVLTILDGRAVFGLPWDLGIFFPDCTYLCSSGLHWNSRGIMVDGVPRAQKTEEAGEFALKLWRAPIAKICIENPKGRMAHYLGRRTQVIHPPQFNGDASKETFLWLRNLEKLRPTGWVEPRMGGLPLFGGDGGRPRWSNQTDSGQNRLGPSPDRAMKRAETYDGVAEAMAEQWGA